MLTLNHDIQDRLINDKAGEIVHVVLQNNAFKKLYIRFLDPQSSLKAMSNRRDLCLDKIHGYQSKIVKEKFP